MPVARVLVISEFFPHAANPHAGIFVHQQLQHLRSAEVVAVLAPAMRYPPLARYAHLARIAPHGHSRLVNGTPVTFVALPYLPLLAEHYLPQLFLVKSQRVIKQHRLAFEAVHAFWAYRSGWVAARLAARACVPLILSVQGSDLNQWLHERRKRGKLLHALHAASRVLVLNRELQDKAIAAGVARENICLVPQGVDVERFAPREPTLRRELQQRWPGHFVYVCIANHFHVKGIDVLLQALALGATSLAVIFVGEGPETAQLQRLAASLKIASRVYFAGAQPPEDIPDWLNAADAVVIPSRSEGGPAVLLEALACGKPVVATRTGMVPEVLADSTCGLKVPPADPQALSAAMMELTRRSWDHHAIRERALHYAWPEISAQISNTYREVISYA